MDFDTIGTIERIIENAERYYLSIYIYDIIKAQKKHIKLIISACQNITLKRMGTSRRLFKDVTATKI